MRRSSVLIAIIIALFWFIGCGEEDSPSGNGNGDGIEIIQTGVSGTDYLNIEHGFRLSNLPASDWVIETRSGKDIESNSEEVLLMAYTTEDKFVTDRSELEAAGIPYIQVGVIGPYPGSLSNPDLPKEVMNNTLVLLEMLGFEVVSKKPVVGVNSTGYEIVVSISMEDTTFMQKQAFFAKNDMGYSITLVATEDMFTGMLAYVDPVIAGFELLGL